MRAVQVTKAKGPLELVERDIPQPGTNEIRIKVQACGVCHSDVLTKEGIMPGIQYPRVPGHEVVGIVDAVGANETEWKIGEKVGVGWHGGYCGECDNCRRGNFFACVWQRVTGITYDGGYAEYMIAPASAVALQPDGLTPAEAAPLMCAWHHHFQRPAEQRRDCRRSDRGSWPRGSWPSRCAIRRQDGLQNRRHRARRG